MFEEENIAEEKGKIRMYYSRRFYSCIFLERHSATKNGPCSDGYKWIYIYIYTYAKSVTGGSIINCKLCNVTIQLNEQNLHLWHCSYYYKNTQCKL